MLCASFVNVDLVRCPERRVLRPLHRRRNLFGRLRQQAHPSPPRVQGAAARGKASTNRFFGLELHTVINSKAEQLRVQLTPGNTDDRKQASGLCHGLFGLPFAGKGCIAQWLTEALAEQGIRLVTTVKKNMKPKPPGTFEKAVLRCRSFIETVFDRLENLCQGGHTRHRSVANFAVRLRVGIVAHCLSDDKPSLSLIHANALVKD